MTSPTHWTDRLNDFGRAGIPCFFLLDFEMRKPLIFSSTDVDQHKVRFDFPGRRERIDCQSSIRLVAEPIPFERYERAFQTVRSGLQRGDSFLTNLTFPTPIELTGKLADVYACTAAKYRILLPGEFVCFSPETFVTVNTSNYLETRPMKGTALDNPEAISALLSNPKEIAEHATIVDLMRNDLSRVASGVKVTRYRYVRAIESGAGGLIQTSSKIGGRLPANWASQLGSLMQQLLPAGSVSGAPKSATLDLIRAAEEADRGYYCGIGGYFDGKSLDTCVLIRFVERMGDSYVFRSGGGITAQSDVREEYEELQAKIRLPRGSVGRHISSRADV